MIRQLRSVPQEIQSIAYLANSVKIRAGTRNLTHFKNLENFLRRKKVPAEIRRTPTLREIRPKQKSNETSICKADYNTGIRTVSTFSLSRGSCPRREGTPHVWQLMGSARSRPHGEVSVFRVVSVKGIFRSFH